MTTQQISSELRTCLTSSRRLELLESTVSADQLTDSYSNLGKLVYEYDRINSQSTLVPQCHMPNTPSL